MRRLADNGGWFLFVLWIAVALAGLVLTIATWSTRAAFADSATSNARDIVLSAVFAAVGVVLAVKRSRNAVGWLFLGVALALAVNVLFTRYAVYGLITHPGSLPGAVVAAALSGSGWLFIFGSFELLLLLFPEGRLPSRRWRPVVWALPVIVLSTWSAYTLAPGPLPPPLADDVNPLGIEALRPVARALAQPGWLLMLIFVACAVSLVRRFRAAEGIERLQYKWFAFAAALFPCVMLLTLLVDAVAGAPSLADTIASTITGLVATAIPVATAVAVLRYRLYDIDRIVSRTVAYALLTLVLGGAYVGLVLASETVLAPIARGSSVAVAVSTLIVAGLFLPVRTRVQRLVDRHFYRSKIDAEATLARFGTRLQHEADLDALLRDVRSVVTDALAPAHVSLWLRSDTRIVRNDLGTPMSYKGGT